MTKRVRHVLVDLVDLVGVQGAIQIRPGEECGETARRQLSLHTEFVVLQLLY